MNLRNLSVQGILSLILVAQLSLAMAASPVIGVATARGSFRIDQAAVSGNGTLFDGTTIETGKASSDVELAEGARMLLGAGTRGRVYRDRMILEKGAGELRNGAGYRIEARSLRILPASQDAVGRVEVKNDRLVQVASLRGSFQVVNAYGVTIATLAAGRSLEFEPQAAGAAAPSTLTGCVVKHDTHFLLTDETAGVTVQLRGGGVDKHVGHRVEVTGASVPSATPASGASHVIQVASFKELSRRCPAPVAGVAAGGAAAGGAKAGTGAAKAAGMSAASKAVIAGVIIAGAAAGTAVAVTAADDSGTISR